MKTKVLFCTLFVCLCVFAQSDFERLKQQYEQSEEQYQEIHTKDSTEIANLKVKLILLTEELNQKEEERETAKSIKAKKLDKQIGNLVAEVSQLEVQIKEYENEIEKALSVKDSLLLAMNNVLERTSEDTSSIEIVDEKEDIKSPSEEPKLEDLEEKDELCSEAVIEVDSTSSEPVDDDPVGTLLFVIGLIVIVVIIARIKTERCPYCGKKGSLKSIGDTRKYQYDENGNVTRKGVLKRYKCNHCGKYVEKLKWS